MTLPILIRFLASICAIALVLCPKRGRGLNAVLLATIGGLAVLQAKMILAAPIEHSDMEIFWNAGQALWNGGDPYAGPVLSTPNTLPLFALFALLPLSILPWVWKWFCMLGCGALCFLSWRLIATRSLELSKRAFTGLDLFALSSIIVLSDVSIRNNALGGSLHVLTAVMVILGLIMYEKGRLGLAGLALALACVKVHSVLPFLLVLPLRGNARFWFAFGFTIATLVFLATPPAMLPIRISSMLANVQALSAPGGGNDYSFQGPANAGILAFNHLFYRLGLRDRSVIGVLYMVFNLVLLLWAAARVRWSEWSRSAKYSLLALVSVIFLYHRLYDTVILALPLTYAVARAHTGITRRGRRLYSIVAVSIVFVMCIPEYTLWVLTSARLTGVLQAVLLPSPFWAVLTAIVAFDFAERVEMAAENGKKSQVDWPSGRSGVFEASPARIS